MYSFYLYCTCLQLLDTYSDIHIYNNAIKTELIYIINFDTMYSVCTLTKSVVKDTVTITSWGPFGVFLCQPNFVDTSLYGITERERDRQRKEKRKRGRERESSNNSNNLTLLIIFLL